MREEIELAGVFIFWMILLDLLYHFSGGGEEVSYIYVCIYMYVHTSNKKKEKEKTEKRKKKDYGR